MYMDREEMGLTGLGPKNDPKDQISLCAFTQETDHRDQSAQFRGQ